MSKKNRYKDSGLYLYYNIKTKQRFVSQKPCHEIPKLWWHLGNTDSWMKNPNWDQVWIASQSIDIFYTIYRFTKTSIEKDL